ncbi:MAG: NAD(P)/FAD-dependent oxidoreductase [Saccharofermentanales bacterium]
MSYDMIVIGKGPAGISAAIYGARANKKVLVIAKDSGWLANTDLVENYYGFEQPVDAKDLLAAGIRQATRLGVAFDESEVVSIDKIEDFEITTTTGSHKSKTLIIATGLPRKISAIKNLKEFEGRGVGYCVTCDGFFYRGKVVGVVGNSDYSYNEATELLAFTKNITIYTSGRNFEGKIYKAAQFDPNIKLDLRKISSVEGSDKIEKIVFEDGSETLIDGLFIAEGTASALDLSYKLGIANNGKTISTERDQSTNIPGLFAAGDCTGGILQVSVAVGEGATAGLSAIKYLRGTVPLA